jgi:PmbA protein
VDEAARAALAKNVLNRSNADQTEVLIGASDSALMRFTHEMSNQNIATSDVEIAIRAIVDGRTGVARTNRVDDASLNDVVERAIEMAKLAPRDPMQSTLPGGAATTAPAGSYDAQTAAASPERRAEMCDAIFREAEDAGYWCAGYASTGADGITVANTSGALASFDGSAARVNVKMNASDSTGFAEACGNAVGRIDAGAAGRRAVEKARASARPHAAEPGNWTVILEPAAFGELLAYITPHFSAQAFEEGSSFCSDGLDRSYFSENFSILDDYAHPLSPGMPFDYEGQPKLRLPLVENGVARNIVTDSYYAHKMGRPNTGHALPAPNAYGPQPMHVVVPGGAKPFDQLVAETKRGLLITRFWYVRTVDHKRAIVTGMTRDGTFMIEDGRIAGGVRNLRFNQSIIEAFGHCEFGSEQVPTGGYNYTVVVPPVKIDSFTFTSSTEF